ncbi:hypothetical protein BDQ94DRAFT_38446 [Aspergillus welwitschiae]|uniref:Secreted protein n=1 Tax=Aspergillus welwitschiae TaxID=1341132 RepID=A0A3F3Q091_9EURO|nr:hypothetical protein BDQ94DRAFT_38446 [Aspergillus welwitschiae]RDH32588.1 hypothetical protein BDQ94DRAFT_38446 [Aspergillus welwitschiae]
MQASFTSSLNFLYFSFVKASGSATDAAGAANQKVPIRDGPRNDDGIFFPSISAVYLSTLLCLDGQAAPKLPSPTGGLRDFVGLLLLRHQVV